MRWRRLVRDYELFPETPEALVKWAMIGLMLNRLARPQEPPVESCNSMSSGKCQYGSRHDRQHRDGCSETSAAEFALEGDALRRPERSPTDELTRTRLTFCREEDLSCDERLLVPSVAEQLSQWHVYGTTHGP